MPIRGSATSPMNSLRGKYFPGFAEHEPLAVSGVTGASGVDEVPGPGDREEGERDHSHARDDQLLREGRRWRGGREAHRGTQHLAPPSGPGRLSLDQPRTSVHLPGFGVKGMRTPILLG
jgi:hypothetical protein